MPFQDRRPSFSDGTAPGEGVKPDEDTVDEDVKPEGDDIPDVIVPPSEGEGTPTDPDEEKDPDGIGEQEEDTVDAPIEEPEKPKIIEESVESLEATKLRLLQEVKELRSERRDLKGNPFEKKVQPEQPVFIKPEEDPLKDVNPEDRSVIEKVVEARLRAGGFVRKDELQTMTFKEKIQTKTDEWIQENQEFDKDNDPNDEKWNKINAYVSRMFAPPSKPEDVKEMLDIARERLFGKKTAPLPQKSIKSVAAKKEKIAISSKPSFGSGASHVSSPTGEKIDKALLQHLQGFSDEELQELAS